jgi:hypothetical protein
MNLDQLSQLAELNLCEKCFRVYKALIEPSIKPMRFKPLDEWRWVESEVTQMVMKENGVVKGDVGIISIDEFVDKRTDEEMAKQFNFDPQAFRRIKRWGFKKKIDYLRSKGVLQNHSYTFLRRVSLIRNRIHELFTEFSESDLELFHYANVIASQISFNTLWHKDDEELISRTKANIEKFAESLCNKYNP